MKAKARKTKPTRAPRHEADANLLAALRAIVAAWDAIPEGAQVPDEINAAELWDDARVAIKKARAR